MEGGGGTGNSCLCFRIPDSIMEFIVTITKQISITETNPEIRDLREHLQPGLALLYINLV